MITIRFTLTGFDLPPGHVLAGWEPEFKITGTVEPIIAAVAHRSPDQCSPAEGGEVEISDVKILNTRGCATRSAGTSCLVCEKREQVFRDLIANRLDVRAAIEDALATAAQRQPVYLGGDD